MLVAPDNNLLYITIHPHQYIPHHKHHPHQQPIIQTTYPYILTSITVTYTLTQTDLKPLVITDDNSYYQSPVQIITDFLASRHQYLQPLVSISQMDNVMFQSVSDLLVYDVRVEYQTNSPDVTNNKSYYKLVMHTMIHSQSNTILVKVNTIFFSIELQSQYAFTTDIPLFYSFKIKHQQTHIIDYSDLNIDIPIKLPISLNKQQFLLPQDKVNYQIVGYLTGVDLNQSSKCWAIGMVSTTTLSTRDQINVGLQFSKTSSFWPQIDAILRSFTINVFIYNKQQLKSTPHYIESRDVRFGNYNTPYQSLQFPSTTDLSQCQSIIGMTGAYTHYINNKVVYKFKAQSSISPTNNQQITFVLSYLNVYLAKNRNYFIIFGTVRCKQGWFYNFAIQDCQQIIIVNNIISNVPANYYVTDNDLYSNLTYYQCISSCMINPLYSVSYHTCMDIYGNYKQCIPCLTNQLSTLNPLYNTPNQHCQTCPQLFFQPQCIQCTHDECLKCDNNKQYIGTECLFNNGVVCDDKLWMVQKGEECDNVLNLPHKGCLTNICKIQQGFKCIPSLYIYVDQPSQCYFIKPIDMKFLYLTKQQFSNTLTITYHLGSQFYNREQYLINLSSTLTITFPQLDNITINKIQYNPIKQLLVVEINYDKHDSIVKQYINNNMNNSSLLQLQINNLQLNMSVLNIQHSPTTSLSTKSSTSITYQLLTHAYYLNTHTQEQFIIAQMLVIMYQLANIIGVVFVIMGFIGGKYIVIQVMSVLQVTYLGLLMMDRYTPGYLAVNRLSNIAGVGLVMSSSNMQGNNYNYNFNNNNNYHSQQLHTLKLSQLFLQNCNIQLVIFVICIVVGVICLVLEKVIKTPKYNMILSIINSNLLTQYALYGLMLWGYVISACVGIQIKYQLLSPTTTSTSTTTQQINIPSLTIGLSLILILLIYSIVYYKHSSLFGEFYRQMIKFSITQKLIVLIILQKVIVGLGLGMFHQFKYIGFVLGGVEVFVILVVFYIKPFYYAVYDHRMIFNHFYVMFVLVVYNLQKLIRNTNFSQQQQNIPTLDNPWCYSWPVVFLSLIYILLIKNMFFIIKQFRLIHHRWQSLKVLYKQYLKHQQIKSKLKQQLDDKQNLLVQIMGRIGKKVGNNQYQNQEENQINKQTRLKQWKNYTKLSNSKYVNHNVSNGLFDNIIKKKDDNKKGRQYNKNIQHQQQGQLMNSNFRAKIQMNRLDKTIKKKLQSKVLLKQTKQTNVGNKQSKQIDNNMQEQQQQQQQCNNSKQRLNNNKTQQQQQQQQQIIHLKESQHQHQLQSQSQSQSQSQQSQKQEQEQANLTHRKLLNGDKNNIFDQHQYQDKDQNQQQQQIITNYQFKKIGQSHQYFQKSKTKNKNNKNKNTTPYQCERDIIQQIQSKKLLKKQQQQRQLMTSDQYKQKIKHMSFYDHWDQIELNAKKYQQQSGEQIKNKYSQTKHIDAIKDYSGIIINNSNNNIKQDINMINNDNAIKQQPKLSPSQEQKQDDKMFSYFQKHYKNKSQKQPIKKIQYRGGFKFSQLSKQINDKNQ